MQRIKVLDLGRRGQRRSRGVPLAGILLTLIAVAAIAGVAIPGFFGRHEWTLDNAAVLIGKELHAARDRSAYLGQISIVVFDDDGLQVLDPTGRLVLRPGTNLPFERRFSVDAVFEGVRLERIEFGADNALHYDGRGRAMESGELVLRYKDERRIVRVQGTSGRIHIDGLTRRWVDREP